MAAFAIGFELREGMYHGVKKFADPKKEWREPYVKLLQELGVTLQIWYLYKSPWPNVLDKCIVYTEAANAERHRGVGHRTRRIESETRAKSSWLGNAEPDFARASDLPRP